MPVAAADQEKAVSQQGWAQRNSNAGCMRTFDEQVVLEADGQSVERPDSTSRLGLKLVEFASLCETLGEEDGRQAIGLDGRGRAGRRRGGHVGRKQNLVSPFHGPSCRRSRGEKEALTT